MTTTLPAPVVRTPPAAPTPQRRRRASRLSPSWPLTALFLGFPLWWLLGLTTAVLPLLAVPMAVQLYRRGGVQVPKGFGWWLLYTVWLVGSTFVLWADAPGAAEGGGLTRLLTHAHRFSFHVAATVMFLYVGNLSEKELPTSKVLKLVGAMFVFTTAGGFLGMLAPDLPLRSVAELVLPASITSVPYVYDQVHPTIAQVQSFLGFDQARPAAPFAFTNEWGANIGMFLPFFVVAWMRKGSGWRRGAAAAVLLASVVPIVYSLNRGLWLGLGAAGVYLVVRMAMSGKVLASVALVAAALVAAVGLLSTSLYEVAALRVSTPHSNEGREELAVESLRVALSSPVVGYGTTRDPAGNFETATTVESDSCPTCGAPPFGTHGHLYRIVFTSGYVGAAFFLVFMTWRFLRHSRDDDPVSVAACTAMVVFACFSLYYNLVPYPLVTLMVGLGLAWRRTIGGAPAPAGAAAPALEPAR